MGGPWAERVAAVAGALWELGLGAVSEEAFIVAVRERVAGHMEGLATGVYGRPLLGAAERCARAARARARCRLPLPHAPTTHAAPACSRLTLQRRACLPQQPRAPSLPSRRRRTQTPLPKPRQTAKPNRFVHHVPFAFLRLVLPESLPGAAAGLADWRQRLSYLQLETLGRLRVSEMFDLVVDFPDSLPAVREVGACLAGTSLTGPFVRAFREALQRRLLHVGAATSDILLQYVSTIKARARVYGCTGVWDGGVAHGRSPLDAR